MVIRQVKFIAGRAGKDCEKLLTPGIVFGHKNKGELHVIFIGAGWWDFYIGITARYITDK